ncbi:Gfo/Idh/MocA family oxidoreductase [Arthrobacter deserti]|uniref:Gfo/Idh/MocA family oxidoreductase n=1 Tax=Arthrobacter deserti TaxID=1742687 RepID=A0ABX1JQ04_9MICC|nr:Gfo/Idh/MocA family oxidoreductase [Arthrobacter deserti]
MEATGRPLRWGVVSTGRMAGRVTEDIARLEDAVLQAVSSRTGANALDFRSRFGFAASYFDTGRSPAYAQLFGGPPVDVVYVATPHGQHYEIARRALEAGKHVLCEKALALNARAAGELVDLARARSLFLMEAVWSRFLPSVNRAWQIIASGELGAVHWVQADLGFPAPYDPGSRLWNPAAGGGALLGLAVYPLTWVLGALGFPQTVTAVGHVNEDGVDDQNALTLTYSSGAQAQLTSSLLAWSPRTATVAGAHGWLRTDPPLHNPPALVIEQHRGPVRTERFGQIGNGFTYQLREVTRCIQAGLTASPTMPWDHTLKTMRLFDGVRAQLGVGYASDRVPAAD